MIEKCPADKVKILAQPVVEQYGVNVIRKPAKTLVMVRMRETVAKAEFYLGELLASEALVELEGVKGFSLLMGDDLDKAFSAAVLDALRRSGLPQWEAVRQALEEEEARQQVAVHGLSPHDAPPSRRRGSIRWFAMSAAAPASTTQKARITTMA